MLVPNSLGPGELLLNYGTDEQKRRHLPRLARGLDIPCFALTSPQAGSDAASIPDWGVVCYGEHEGRRVLGLRVTWDKRYITLGPVATLLGLAFRAYDPDHLVGDREDLGITCALIPTSHPGVDIGRRHMPLNAVFQNGPNSGARRVHPDGLGDRRRADARQGLADADGMPRGRAAAFRCRRRTPAWRSSPCARRARTRACARSSRRRSARFEGVEEALTRMGGNLYMMDAVAHADGDVRRSRRKARGAVRHREAAHHRARNREVINDAMDIAGGKGICMGPSNFLGAAYMQMPVSITVEGANILTRSLIVFGQGAIRCHPYVLREMAATREPDAGKALRDFDAAFFGHLRFAAWAIRCARWSSG